MLLLCTCACLGDLGASADLDISYASVIPGTVGGSGFGLFICYTLTQNIAITYKVSQIRDVRVVEETQSFLF